MKRFLKSLLYWIGINPHKFLRKNADFEVDIAFEALKKIKNGTMIDVGFAWGHASLPFLIKNWHVFAFEPDEVKSKRNAIKKLTHHFPRLVISKEAVSSSNQNSLPFFVSDESEGIASLHSFKNHELSHQVSAVPLNTVILRHLIEKIHFLKIDVEGHDLSVLHSLDFETHKPIFVLVEFDDFKTKPLGYEYSTIGDFLCDKGYEVLMFEWNPIKRYGSTHSLKQIKNYPLVRTGLVGDLIS